MIYRTLGRTGLKVSLVSYGSGGPSKLGQNTGLSSYEQDRLIHRCVDEGINLFDTSEAYGDSELILGRSLENYPRDSYVLATKCKYLDRDGTLRTPEAIADSIENSLRRLKVDCLDIPQFHIFNSRYYFDVVERRYPVLKRFQEQGKIRFIGFSEQFKVERDHLGVALALEIHPELWDVIQLKYGILNQTAADKALPPGVGAQRRDRQHGGGSHQVGASRVAAGANFPVEAGGPNRSVAILEIPMCWPPNANTWIATERCVPPKLSPTPSKTASVG